MFWSLYTSLFHHSKVYLYAIDVLSGLDFFRLRYYVILFMFFFSKHFPLLWCDQLSLPRTDLEGQELNSHLSSSYTSSKCIEDRLPTMSRICDNVKPSSSDPCVEARSVLIWGDRHCEHRWWSWISVPRKALTGAFRIAPYLYVALSRSSWRTDNRCWSVDCSI